MPNQSKKVGAGRTTATFKQEIQRLAEAMTDGRLDERGDISSFVGEDAELLASVNQMLDALVSPLRLASGSISEIAHGRIPAFVIDDYKGEFNSIKLNLNTLLATLYGMHNETQNLIGGISDGKLRTRGNDWDFDGIWRDLIAGVNGTLDAVLDPVSEASTVLERLANYDLKARMQGRYHGDHAVIKKAINTTAESLHSAVSQVAETVELVSTVGGKIALSSDTVSHGASEQECQLTETTATLNHLAGYAQLNAANTADAQVNAKVSVSSITTARNSMERMLKSMDEIKSSADNTLGIVQDIDTIAKETDRLSRNAGTRAGVVRTSASGFSVVASEVRRLAEQCEEAVNQLQEFQRLVAFAAKDGDPDETTRLTSNYEYLIHDLKTISTNSNLLGVNAAISAAHVEGAGNDFEGLTGEIRDLARRAAEAARQSDIQLRASARLARGGEEISREIYSDLEKAVNGANSIDRLTEEIARGTHEQASGLEQISRSIYQINDITGQNAAVALESASAAKDLSLQVKKLSEMVNKFSFSA